MSMLGSRTVRGARIARIVFTLTGCAAIAWATLAIPTFWSQSSSGRVANHIIDGLPFKTDALARFAAVKQDERCRPAGTRAAAIVRLRILEDMLAAGERGQIDSQAQLLHEAVRHSLACAPADAFLWLILMWVESIRYGYQADQLAYLRMSHAVGPGEGWVALRRSRLALALFEQLPPDLAEATIGEFARLLNSGFDREAIAIFTGPGWRVREKLLPALTEVTERHRRIFARTLYALGYHVPVQGIELPERRPWH